MNIMFLNHKKALLTGITAAQSISRFLAGNVRVIKEVGIIKVGTNSQLQDAI